MYDLAGMRADADYMVWWHAEEIESLQAAYADWRRTTALGRASVPVWSQAALHRPAEFNKSHVPAFLAGEEPRRYVCVYPFVRSYDWYLLPDAERRQMLAEHGKAARGYPDVRANTVSSFALGDYEWILAFEADELHRIVDLMRDLRATEARRHVREEIPFFTGPRVQVGRPGRDPAVGETAAARRAAVLDELEEVMRQHGGTGSDDAADPRRPRRRSAPMNVVLDASVAVVPCCRSERRTGRCGSGCASPRCHAPHLVDAEVGSVLRRRGGSRCDRSRTVPERHFAPLKSLITDRYPHGDVRRGGLGACATT